VRAKREREESEEEEEEERVRVRSDARLRRAVKYAIAAQFSTWLFASLSLFLFVFGPKMFGALGFLWGVLHLRICFCFLFFNYYPYYLNKRPNFVSKFFFSKFKVQTPIFFCKNTYNTILKFGLMLFWLCKFHFYHFSYVSSYLLLLLVFLSITPIKFGQFLALVLWVLFFLSFW